MRATVVPVKPYLESMDPARILRRSRRFGICKKRGLFFDCGIDAGLNRV